MTKDAEGTPDRLDNIDRRPFVAQPTLDGGARLD